VSDRASERAVRASLVLGTLRYLETHAPDLFGPARQVLPAEVAATVGTARLGDWLAPEIWVEVLRAFVATCGAVRARAELERCGRALAAEASGTFLRIVLRRLAPDAWPTKLPEIWARDHRVGHLVIDAPMPGAARLRARLLDVAGVDFLPVVTAGYLAFTLEAAVGARVDVTVEDFDFARPGPEEARYSVVWAKDR
jgi:hypothetical protein